MAPELKMKEEIGRFRQWAEEYPTEERSGEWECDYPDWSELNKAVLDFIECNSPDSWTSEQLESVLYALARDNEISFLAYTVGQQHPEILRCLAAAALEQGEPDAKWQLAVELGREGTLCAEAEGLLLRMAQEEGDENEYVRRRALKELATLNSLHTEQLALTAWNEPGENQQWARMAALWSLHRVQAPSLERLLAESEVDTRPHLSAYAQRMRRGEADE